jgi:hypothetical protein
MRPVEEYRNHAAECSQLAQKVPDLKDKALWFVMAEAWLRLAEDAATLRDVVAPPVEIASSGKAA